MEYNVFIKHVISGGSVCSLDDGTGSGCFGSGGDGSGNYSSGHACSG